MGVANATEVELPGVLADAWVEYQRHVDRLPASPETARSYLSCTGSFLAWVAGQDRHKHAEVLTDEQTAVYAARDYIKHLLKERESKPSTAKAHLTAMGNFYASRKMPKPHVPAVAGSVRAGDPKALTEEEMTDVFRAAERRGIRDHAIVAMFYHAGPRIAECHDLNAQDVNLMERKGDVTIRYGKGGKQRVVELNGQAVRVLSAWESVRHHQLGMPADRGPYFVNPENNERLAITSIRHAIKQVAKAAGVDMTPHTLRHTFGTRLARKGVDPFTIRDLMGHSSVETTGQYTRSNQADRRAAVELLTIDY